MFIVLTVTAPGTIQAHGPFANTAQAQEWVDASARGSDSMIIVQALAPWGEEDEVLRNRSLSGG